MTQIDYTSRDFAGLRDDLIQLINTRTNLDWNPTDYSDLGNVLVEAFAYMGDIMSHYIDRAANETTVDNAIQQSTLLNFGNLYGYKPSGPTPATVNVTFTNVSANTIDIPKGTQVIAPLSYGPYAEIYFETTSGAVGVLPDQTITLSAIEGKTVNTDRPDLIDPVYHKPIPTNIGLTTGLPNQNIDIPFDTNIVDGSLTVYIGQGAAFAPWTYVNNLLEQTPEALVFTTKQNTDGTLTIIFGDNINGAIPPASQLISALYKTSAGAAGNVVADAISEISFIPGNLDPQAITYFTVTNAAAAIGGADADDQTQIKKKIKAAIASRRRAVTLADYENLALLVPQVGKAKATGASYSSINLYIQPQNDPSSLTPGVVSGTPTSSWDTLATNVSNYLADKIPVGTTVSVFPPTYVPVYLTLAITIADNQSKTAMQQAVYTALIGTNGLFAYDNNPFNRTITVAQVITTVNSIPGIKDVTITAMNIDNLGGASSLGFKANEIPYLSINNLTIPTPTGGV